LLNADVGREAPVRRWANERRANSSPRWTRRSSHCAQQMRSNSALRALTNHHAPALLFCCNALLCRVHGGRRGGDPSMACKESEAHPLGRQQSASNRTSRSLASHVIALGPRLSTCGVVMWRPATPGSRCGGRSLHTAEVTGPIPVTPTSENASRSRSNGPFARRFARRWAWPCSSWRSASLHPSRWQATRLLCAVNSGSANSASSATHGLPTCCGSAGG